MHIQGLDYMRFLRDRSKQLWERRASLDENNGPKKRSDEKAETKNESKPSDDGSNHTPTAPRDQ